MSNVGFIVHDSSGLVLRSGYCQTDFVEMQACAGEFSLVSDASYLTHYVLDGEVLPYTEAELASKNNLPRGFIWKMPERIAIDSRALPDAKEHKWAIIKDARTAAESAPFTCDGSVYQADKERISGAVQLALLAQLSSQPFSIIWTLEGNTTKPLDATQMIGVGAALGMSVSAAFDTARQLREQIDAAATIEEVDAIGWPV